MWMAVQRVCGLLLALAAIGVGIVLIREAGAGTAALQAAAWDFTKWWNSPETQITWNVEGSYIPFSTTAAQSPEVQQFWQNDLAGRWLALAYQQLSQGVDPDWPGPLIGPYDDVRRAIENGLNELTLEGKSAQDVVTQAADAATAAIERYNEGNF